MIMNKVNQLIQSVQHARQSYLVQIEKVNEVDALWKPSQHEWNVAEITEHLFWAEQGGIFGMWKVLNSIREGRMERNFESRHKYLPIEEIIRQTWQPKEQVPPVAAPRMGGTLAFWRFSLNSLQVVLDGFGQDIQEDELRLQAHPHPISGPMDFQQRLEFLAFHINRHKGQVEELLNNHKGGSHELLIQA
jgi:DinB superfamily